MPFRTFLLATSLFCATGALGATTPPSTANRGLLFSLSGQHGTTAEKAGGMASPIFSHGVRTIPDGAIGPGLSMDDALTLAWSAPGNIYAERGTLSFFFRARTPLSATPFTIFRVGAADGTSWDMTFLRIDWNGHGFDAFVTDASLARTRVHYVIPTVPAADQWVHIAFAWDEAQGVTLWIDGKKVASKQAQADYDIGLFGFGPFQRIVSPHQVQSGYNYMRSGDIDEIRIYDHALDDAQVAALARHQQPEVPPAAPRSLTTTATADEWRLRFGWDRIAGPTDYDRGAAIGIRKVEFSDTRDQKEKMFRGADGIRETTWPGVYNRSRLPGRDDYFELPDWNVYSTGGKDYTLTLPDEPWNHIEIIGSAYGTLALNNGDKILDRPKGAERTSTQLAGWHRGGVLDFHNIAQETPIQEIGAYDVTAIHAVPQGIARLTYTIDPDASPLGYASLKPLTDRIAGRYPMDERATVVALPAGAPMIAADAATRHEFPIGADRALPVVRILIPATFRDQPPGGTPRRFSYGWENLDGGLDGVAIELPKLGLKPGVDGLVPLNVRIHDPLWPDRDLADVIVKVRPDRPQTLWIDTRDRILPPGRSFSLSIASDDPAFSAKTLAGASISLVFKPRDAAKAEHIADRLEQARDELSFLVEEQPSTRLYPVWDRFERDVTDVLRIDPDNRKARALWNEKNPEQPYWPTDIGTPPAGVPAWAYRQTQDLGLFRKFVDWWIDHRQIADGEFGGGLSDDTDLVNQWVPLALMGVEPDRLRRSQRAVLDATFADGMWDNGLSHIEADQLHSYEEGINTVAQAMMLSWGDPTEIERAMAVARNYPRLIQRNPAGHWHFVSAYFNGRMIDRDGNLGRQYPYSYLITHPGMLLVEYNGAPKVKSLLLESLNSWLAHGRQGADGNWSYPQEIQWNTDQGFGKGVGNAVHSFWAAYKWTGDAKYLRPIEPAGLAAGSLSDLFAVNADTLAQIPGGPELAKAIASGKVTTGSAHYDQNIGTTGDDRIADYVRWQETGDNHILASLYADDVRQDMHRMYFLTAAEAWSDRVAVPSDLLQRARMGGVAHLRNRYYPGNLVSWRFAGPDLAQQVGILIPHGNPDRFRVVAYNLSDRPITASMIGGELKPGLWHVRSGIDGNGDNQADNLEAERTVRLEKGLGTDLVLPPHQTIVYDFDLAQAGDDPATRPDIGISADDLHRQGDTLTVRVHSLGAKPTPTGLVTIMGPDGKQLAQAPFAGLQAPIDLLPKTEDVSLPLPAGTPRAGLTVTLTLDGGIREVTAANNQARTGTR